MFCAPGDSPAARWGLVPFREFNSRIDFIVTGTPLPLVFWNDGVTAGLPSKSLENKDLYAKYSGIRT
jgi:hypothetical protein